MNAAHLHLLLNHIPILGAFGLFVLFVVAFLRRDTSLGRLTLGFSVLLAAVSVGVFFTGEPAEEIVEDLAGAVSNAIEPHEEAALVATIAFGVLGTAALAALVGFRRRELPRWLMGAAIIGTLTVSGFMGWTANLGGQIRHTEFGSAVGAPGSEGSDEDEPPSSGHER